MLRLRLLHQKLAGMHFGCDLAAECVDFLHLLACRLLRGADAAHKVGQLLNLWVFLYQGKYRWACCES
jgi:hypothetical protein